MDVRYALWLSGRLERGSAAMDKALKLFGSCESVYNAGAEEYIKAGLGKRECGLLADKSFSGTEKILEDCEKYSLTVLPYESPDYPERLKEIFAPPALLYVQGELPEVDYTPLITIVGTRDCTEYGRKAARRLGYDLAKCGFTVVSGLALGIDAAAHTGALSAHGKCIAVIGCGHNENYPAANADIRRELEKCGSVLSEYQPFSKIYKTNYPTRNRIMAGLSLGVIVAEAPEKSGSLITAARALEYGRDIYAVPGSMFSQVCAGSNKLITRGAKLISSYTDVLEEYNQLFPALTDISETREPKRRLADIESKDLSEDEKAVLSVLSDVPKNIDYIVGETGLEYRKVSAVLLMLELNGRCRSYPMKNYSL